MNFLSPPRIFDVRDHARLTSTFLMFRLVHSLPFTKISLVKLIFCRLLLSPSQRTNIPSLQMTESGIQMPSRCPETAWLKHISCSQLTFSQAITCAQPEILDPRTSRLREKKSTDCPTDCLRIVHGQFADKTRTQHQHIQCHTSGTICCAHSGMPLNRWHTEVCVVR